MNSLPVPKGGNQDRRGQLLAMLWTEVPIAIIVVAARIYCRLKIKAMGMDDWVMIVTLVLFIPFPIALTFMLNDGGARHFYYLTPAQREYVTKVDWISQPFNIMSLATAKVSVALLILRLMGPSTFWRKWFLYSCIFLVLVAGALSSIFTFVQCNPPQALWGGLEKFPHAKCWDPSTQLDFSLFTSCFYAFMDFSMALLPITIVWDLNLALKKKLALGTLLSLGVFAGICAVIKTTKLPELAARGDLTWSNYSLFIWAATENLILIVCGSVPAMKPLYDLVHERLKLSTSASAQKRARANRPYRISSTENSTRISAKKANPRRDTDDLSLLELGHINVQRGWEVNSECRQ